MAKMRTRFDAGLHALNDELINMGSMCETAILKAVNALKARSKEQALEVYKSDNLVDRQERSIESLCLSLILHHKPLADDLRNISAALKMITDMERIADQQAEITLNLNFEHADDFFIIEAMGTAVTIMVKKSIDAYVKHDKTQAEEICKLDDEIDEYFVNVKTKPASKMTGSQEVAQTALDLLMIAKCLERIGDHACNIAGRVIFAVTPEHGFKHGLKIDEHSLPQAVCS